VAAPFLPLLLIGAGALALGAKKKKPLRCPPLSQQGGQLEGLSYHEVVTGGADPNARLPMIIVFHGLGDTGANIVRFFEYFDTPARLIFPNGILPWKNNYAWFQLRARTEDQEGLAQEVAYAADSFLPFLRTIAMCRPTVGNPIITGHSQGGIMTLGLATRHRRYVRAAVPVSAWLPPRLWSAKLPTTYAIHGTKDRTVPYDRSAEYYQTIINAGAPVNFTPIQNGMHGLGKLKDQWMATLAALAAPA
jgi:phospholipase/carboxylesterase